MTKPTGKKISIEAMPHAIKGEIELGGSKSIANRALIIQALCPDKFEIKKLSDSKDTVTLNNLLQQESGELNSGHAGTCFRFMTAFLATRSGEQILTGSDRMKQRPIAPLVNALNDLGANITYLENPGYPPLKIESPKKTWKNKVSIDGTMSSQFITALLLIAPTLPNGLSINIMGDLVSTPYVEMTLKMMNYFGINYTWEAQTISIQHQAYQAKEFTVEADWSSASYLYNFVAINPESKVVINGLFQDSLQGDSEIQNFATKLGVKSSWENGKLTIENTPEFEEVFEYDFIKQPDLAQSIACICATKNIKGLFSGLKTLFIKETDRVKALQDELSKVNVFMNKLPSKMSENSNDDFYLIEGNYEHPKAAFKTYQDHRMAMAFASLATKSKIVIEEPDVVVKSFPRYWEEMEKLGFKISIA